MKTIPRSREHLAWIATQRCAVWSRHCDGDVVAHHVRSAATSGTGIKPSDFASVPLCNHHHASLHQIGQKSFQRVHKVMLIDVARMWATKSPYKET